MSTVGFVLVATATRTVKVSPTPDGVICCDDLGIGSGNIWKYVVEVV